ncbi:hypothetical protein ACEXOS_008755 [Herbiconiux sp. P16]|uniref:hypothetical protein n=1 Tax=Herbiconiux wuyangfengii TaxID=3342794 RepID=UPI0035B7778C
MMNQADIYLELRSQAALDAIRVATAVVPHLTDPLDQDLIQTLTERRAVKYFTAERPNATSLQALHADMTAVDETLWPGGAGTGRLRYIFAVSHIEGLDQGLYELSTNQFVFLTPFAPSIGLRDAVLQPEFGDAAAVLLVTGSLLEAVKNRGEHGHRILLSRAGAACEIAWLRVLESGYVASIFAGFLPSMLRLHLEFDGYAQTQLLALAIGMERERG